MIHRMFTIHDQKAEAFLPPFILPQAGQAIRTFSDCVNSDDHQFSKHPGDYTLLEIGMFDDSTGGLDPYPVPKSLGTGVEFVANEPLNTPETHTGSEGNGKEQIGDEPPV